MFVQYIRFFTTYCFSRRGKSHSCLQGNSEHRFVLCKKIKNIIETYHAVSCILIPLYVSSYGNKVASEDITFTN